MDVALAQARQALCPLLACFSLGCQFKQFLRAAFNQYLKFWRQGLLKDNTRPSSPLLSWEELTRLRQVVACTSSALSVEYAVLLGCFRNTCLMSECIAGWLNTWVNLGGFQKISDWPSIPFKKFFIVCVHTFGYTCMWGHANMRGWLQCVFHSSLLFLYVLSH